MSAFNGNDSYTQNAFSEGMGISPVVFAQNVLIQSTQTNNFIKSGILANDPIMSAQLNQPGNKVILPFYNDLYGEPEVWDDSKDITSQPVTTGSQTGVKLYQDQSFSFTDLAKQTQVGDPLAAIQTRFANYWARQDENIVLSTLKGVLSNPVVAAGHVFDQDKDKPFNVESFERAVSLLADLQDDTFTAIAVHPSVYAQMKAQNYLTFDYMPQNQAAGKMPFYNGMVVVKDRRLPLDPATGEATSYIFANGAFKYDTVFPINGGYEFWRHPGVHGGENQIISKRIYSAHLDGTTVADGYAPLQGTKFTRQDLENANMWDCVIDPLNVKVVAYKSNVPAGYASQFFDDEAAGEARNSDAANGGDGKSKSSKSSSSNSTNSSSNNAPSKN